VKKKNSLKLLAVTLVGVVSFSTFVLGGGGDLAQRQADLARQAAEAQANLDGLAGQISVISREIASIESDLWEVIDELNNITAHLEMTRETLYEIDNDLTEAIISRQEQQERLVARARAMHMNGTATHLDVLLSATDFTDLLMRMEFVNRLIEHDQNLVSDLLETEEIIEHSLRAIEIEEQRYMAFELQHTTRMNQYEAKMEERSAILNRMQEDERREAQILFNIERDVREVERLIQAAARAARAPSGPSNNRILVDVPNLGGRLDWPVPARSVISSGYGMRRSPISGRNEFHTGIDIPAPNGTNFVTAGSGVVTFVGWMNGFGNTIIIDHGGGVSTLYAHNSLNSVAVGQSVQARQIIGNIGSTGWSTGPHSHFEVRVNGQHIDPMYFLLN